MKRSNKQWFTSTHANPQDQDENQQKPTILIIASSVTKIDDDIQFSSAENQLDQNTSHTDDEEEQQNEKTQQNFKSNEDLSNEQFCQQLLRAKSQIGFTMDEQKSEVSLENNDREQDKSFKDIEMQTLKMDFLAVPQQYRNIESYEQIYKKKSSVGLGQAKEQLQTIEEDPQGSISESLLDKFSLDNYDCNEQADPSRRSSSESYQLKKPKSSIVQGSGFSFHMDDILEVGSDYILIRVGEDKIEKIEITNKLTHDINKISRYYKKPTLLKPLYQDVNITHAWLLLLVATFANGIIPAWIQYIPTEKYLRLAWRFFMQFFLMIPFSIYERRTGDAKIKAKYSFSFILQLDNLKKIFLSSFTMCTWFAFTLFCFEWTYVSHAIILGNLVNFYNFIYRVVRKESIHYIEIFGAIIVVLGVVCVISNNICFDITDVPPSAYHFKMTKFLHRDNWQRIVFGNGSSLFVSFLMAKMSKHQAAAREVFPPYLNSQLTFFLNMFNLTLFSYFLSGMDFVKDPTWGWYGLFTTENFISFFIMTILLGMGSFVSMSLVNKIFEPLVPQTAQLFEPVITTLSLPLLGVQAMPMGLTCIGYALILPGLFSIILGQYFIQQYKKTKK